MIVTPIKSESNRILLQRSMPLPEGAFDGIAGDFVNRVAEETEADRIAILLHVLTYFGNAVGRGAHFRVGFSLHYAILFALIVGITGKSRKGTSEAPANTLMQQVSIALEIG